MISLTRAPMALLCVALVCGAVAAQAQATDPAAAMDSAQLAFFKRDAAELARLAAATAPWTKSTNPTEVYAHAYVQFRALQAAVGAKRNKDAAESGAACVSALDGAIGRDPRFAEAFALQSACYGYLANLGGFGAIRNGSRSGKSLEPALALAPQNPRVILVEGFGVYFRPKFVGGDEAKGCERFGAAVAAFAERGNRDPAPYNWGAAEAHYWVGRCAAKVGDAAAARRSFEAALTLAPQFAAATAALK